MCRFSHLWQIIAYIIIYNFLGKYCGTQYLSNKFLDFGTEQTLLTACSSSSILDDSSQCAFLIGREASVSFLCIMYTLYMKHVLSRRTMDGSVTPKTLTIISKKCREKRLIFKSVFLRFMISRKYLNLSLSYLC